MRRSIKHSKAIWAFGMFAALVLGCVCAQDIDFTKVLTKRPRNPSNNNKIALTRGEDVVALISPVWDEIVAKHQDGLVDPKQKASALSTSLSPSEAMYHFTAAKEGIIDSARFLLTFGVASSVAEIVASHGEQDPLVKAIVSNDVKQVQYLLDQGMADVNSFKEENDFSSTPLHLAVATSKNNDTDVVEALLKAGAIPSLKAKHGATPLMLAAAMNRPFIARALLMAGARVDESHPFAGTTPLHFAAEMGHEAALSTLCSWLVTEQKLTCEDVRTSSTGGTALHTAADSNRPKVLGVLVTQCKCNVNSLLNGDSTPTYLAAQRGFVGVLKELALLGADLDFAMPRSSTFASDRAAKQRRGLIKAEEDVKPGTVAYDYLNKNTEIGNGATALHAAAENGHLDAVQALLMLKAKQKDSMEGTTPLLIAIQYRHPSIALELLRADDVMVNARSKRDGAFALFAAAGNGYGDVVDRILERRDVDVDQRNAYGATALSHALYRNHVEIARRILQRMTSTDLEACRVAVSSARLGEMISIARTLLGELAQAPSGFHECVQNLVDRESMSTHQKQLLRWIATEDASVAASLDAQKLVSDANLLMVCARAGNVDALETLVDHTLRFKRARDAKALINNVRAGPKLAHATMLYLSVSENRSNVVKWLLDHGADVDLGAKDDRGQEVPALFVAFEKGLEAPAQLLVQEGKADPERAVPIGKDAVLISAIQLAAVNGHVNLVRQFVTPKHALQVLEAATTSGKQVAGVIKVLDEAGALSDEAVIPLDSRINALVRILTQQSQKSSARKHSDVLSAVKLLRRDWTRVPNLGFPPLHSAMIAYADDEDEAGAEGKASELVALLLPSDGAMDDAVALQRTAKTGLTPLALAVEAGRPKILKMVIASMRPNAIAKALSMRSLRGESPLDAARRMRHPELISIIGKLVREEQDKDEL